MAKVSLSKAAKDTGVSLPTLSRWRKNGKISAEKKQGGGYIVDTSEYDRIAELQKSSPNMKGVTKGSELGIATPLETPNESSGLQVEVEVLRERVTGKDKEIDMLKKQSEKSNEMITDLSGKLDQAQQTLHQQTHLLEDMRKEPEKLVQAANENLGAGGGDNTEKAIRGQKIAVLGSFVIAFLLIGFLGFVFWPDIESRLNGAGVAVIAPAAGLTE